MGSSQSAISDQKALDAFVSGNIDLIALESIANRFNIFEALGVVSNERKHSNFLRFLLDPKASHNLGDTLLKRFLQIAASRQPAGSPVTASDIDLYDLSGATVCVERDSIDVLISDPHNNLQVIVENKVESQQHSNQLTRYYDQISGKYPSANVIAVFLTRDEEDPKDERYVSMSYKDVRSLIEETLGQQDIRLSDEIKFSLVQYVDLLGRHFMADAKVKALCARLYKQHRQAIDLIIENMPDRRGLIGDHLKTLISRNGFDLDKCTAAYIRFFVPAIDKPYFSGSTIWTPSGRMLLFEFLIGKDSPGNDYVWLYLQMGGGDMKNRKLIHEFAAANQPPFQVEKKLSPQWQQLYTKPIINSLGDYSDEESIFQAIDSKWREFIDLDLPVIEKLFNEHQWPTA